MMQLETLFKDVLGKIKFNAPLGQYTRFKTGGKADVFYIPSSVDDLVHFLKIKPKDMPVTVIGMGSNLLIRDGGIRGAVIKLNQASSYINPNNAKQIIAPAGSTSYSVAKLAEDNLIGGLEFLSGIPATIGGMIAMNAGANKREMKDILVECKAIDTEGLVYNFSNKDMGFSYRNSAKKNYIFLECLLEGYADTKENIENNMKQIKEHRENHQPYKSKTAGSTFKNMKDISAWQLVRKAGCDDFRVGGARVSSMHANFIINEDNATSKDIEMLITKIENQVKDKLGIVLEREVIVIGENL